MKLQLVENILNEAGTVSANIQNLINAGNKWQDALNQANFNERPVVIDAFIKQWCNANNISEDKITPVVKQMMVKWIEELGFRQNNNPFLDYLKNTLKENNFDEDTLIVLNNLYASKKITARDLRGTGNDKLNHIIFNKDWIEDSHNNNMDDQQFVAEAYIWLSNSENAKSLPVDAIAASAKGRNEYKFPATYQSLSSSFDSTSIRNVIIFKDMTETGSPNQSTQILQAYTIQQALYFVDKDSPEVPSKSKPADKTDFEKLKDTFDRLTDEEKTEFLNLLKGDEA